MRISRLGEVSPSLQTRGVFRYPLSGKLFCTLPGPGLSKIQGS